VPARKQAQHDLFDITPQIRTAACVPAVRQAVQDWKAAGYPGVTKTTTLLLRHWFGTDHRLKNGRPFTYHASQREAIESLVFVWEAEKAWSRKGLLERYANKALLTNVPLPKIRRLRPLLPQDGDGFRQDEGDGPSYRVAVFQRRAGKVRDCSGLRQDLSRDRS